MANKLSPIEKVNREIDRFRKHSLSKGYRGFTGNQSNYDYYQTILEEKTVANPVPKIISKDEFISRYDTKYTPDELSNIYDKSVAKFIEDYNASGRGTLKGERAYWKEVNINRIMGLYSGKITSKEEMLSPQEIENLRDKLSDLSEKKISKILKEITSRDEDDEEENEMYKDGKYTQILRAKLDEIIDNLGATQWEPQMPIFLL